MRWIRRVAAVLGLLAGADRLPAAELRLPPIDGQLAGDIAAAQFPGVPALHWTVTTRSAGERRFVHLAVDGEGTRLRAAAELSAGGDGAWKITDGRLDAGAWWTGVAPRLGPAVAGLEASGEVELSGSGRFVGGMPSGRVQVNWRGGSVREPVAGWVLGVVSLEGDFSFDASRGTVESVEPFRLTVRTITTARFGARNLFVRGRLGADRVVILEEAHVEIAGGHVRVEPCTIPLSPLSIAVQLRINYVGLQDVAALVPTALAAASGRVDGMAEMSWSDANGFKLGAGKLAVRRDEPAEVRLAPTPGLISASLPPSVLKYYPGLGQIETGEIPLRADILEVSFTPEGDAEGRTATVRLTGGPVDPRLRAPIDLTVNVRGPIERLITLGTRSRVQSGRP